MTLPSAETLFDTLVEQLRPAISPETALVGIHTGGAWLAERLHAALGLAVAPGSIDVSFYRDDFSAKGLPARPRRSTIPFPVDDAHILIIDDVLYTGRTTRAALNELFDYGRPASVQLAVLVDRGGRELPIAAQYCALTLPAALPPTQTLELGREENGTLTLRLTDA